MRKLITALLSAGALAVGTLAVAAPAAAAAPATTTESATTTEVAPQQTCAYRHLCVFTARSFGGRQVSFEFSNPNWRNIGPSWITNNDRSWYNNGAPGSVGYARVYDNTNYRNRTVCMAPGVGILQAPGAEARGESNNWGPGC